MSWDVRRRSSRRIDRRPVVVGIMILLAFLLASNIPDRRQIDHSKPRVPELSQQPSVPRQTYQVYSRLRSDRLGAVVLDMLKAHAFCWQQSETYRGACTDAEKDARVLDYERIVREIGLDSILPIPFPSCPSRREKAMVLDASGYQKIPEPELFSTTWLAQVRASIREGPLSDAVVVHMRRGDVTPCSEPERYLSNAQYQALLQHVADPKDVHVYTERVSYEGPLPNATYHYDDDLALVWKAMLQSRVLILSKSSFSYVPALLKSSGSVVYTPFWHEGFPEWTAVAVGSSRHEFQCPP